MRISVVTVVYNGEKYLRDAISSVLNQNYPELEYVIIDGGSTDATVDIIKSYGDQISYWVSEPDKGIYDAMNKGVKKCTGEVIAILNADDMHLPHTLKSVAEKFQSTDADIVYGKMIKVKELEGKNYEQEVAPDLGNVEQTMPIFHPSTFVKKQVYDDLGVFDTRFKVAADYEFIYRCYKAGKRFEYLELPVSKFRLVGISNASCTSYEEAYQILKQYESPYQEEMKNLIGKCKRKTMLRKFILLFSKIPPFSTYLRKRQMKKWNG